MKDAKIAGLLRSKTSAKIAGEDRESDVLIAASDLRRHFFAEAIQGIASSSDV